MCRSFVSQIIFLKKFALPWFATSVCLYTSLIFPNQDNCSHKIRHDVIGPQTIEIVCQMGFKNTQRKSIAKIVCSILTDKKKFIII